eukprot:5530991-Pyramimonas_sp.AAC.1
MRLAPRASWLDVRLRGNVSSPKPLATHAALAVLVVRNVLAGPQEKEVARGHCGPQSRALPRPLRLQLPLDPPHHAG